MNKNKKKNKRNKIFISILITLVIVIIVLVIIGYNFYNRKLNYKEKLSIKIGDEIPHIDSYIDKDELKRLGSNKISWKDIKTEDNKIYIAGEYSGYINYKNKKINLKLEVIDDEFPTIDGVEDITIYVNEEINLPEKVKITDNSHSDVDIKVNGEYDISKVGEYPLSYVATDKSGNETVKEFKLIVKEKEVPKINNQNISNNTSTNENKNIGTSSKGYTIKQENGVYYVDGVLIANKTYALPSSYATDGLLSIFMNNFNSMKNEAANQGISLNIISGYRDYYKQQNLYNRYVNRDGKNAADTYSARPGHSEHQTGLAADINSLETNFINTNEGKWLNDNCYKYGFIIRYPSGKESITGYIYEPWHIRYVGVELATALYNNGSWISLEEYFGITSEYSY